MVYREIIIPYIDKLLISKKMNPKYYSYIKGVGKKVVEIGGRIDTKVVKGLYTIDSKSYILDETGNKIVSNIRTVGKPRYWVVNNQDLYNGKVNKFGRNARMHQLKEAIYQAIKWSNISTIEPIRNPEYYPIKIELFIYTQEMPVDVDNKGVIYHKAFQDLIRDLKVIPDDKSEFINDTGRTKWIKSDLNQMKFVISKSNFTNE